MNMTPQYRSEYRHLNNARKKIMRDFRTMVRDVKKRKTALDKLVTRQKHSCERATAHIARRMAILQGRIDS